MTQANSPQATNVDIASVSPSLDTLLSSITVVMINTTLPANIGSAARAMHTMGLTNLTVVAPKHPIDETSIAHAAGGQAILVNCHIAPTLDDAIADSQLIFAASSRNRHIPRPVVTPNEAGDIIKAFISSQTYSVTDSDTATPPNIAILFGREDRGLTNDELARADYHIQIDANPDYPVLNVASAIQVIASFLYANFIHTTNHLKSIKNIVNDGHAKGIEKTDKQTYYMRHYLRQQWDVPPITQEQQQQLEQRIISLMQNLTLIDAPVDALDKDSSASNNSSFNTLSDLPNRLARLTSRLQLDEKEFALLNSIIAKINAKI